MHLIVVSGITVEVVRKDIKNLHLGIYPPDGRVRAATPLLVDDEAVRLAVISRLDWIKRQKARFQEQQRQPSRSYVNRESHYFQGRRYLLNVVEHDGPAKVIRRGRAMIDLFVPTGAGTSERERAMSSWYREELKVLVPPLVEKWSERLGVEVVEWKIKRMKTKWGSCNAKAKRIWLNLELAKKPARCLEYVIVHEMVHLFEKSHNARFQELMDHHMPEWRSYRDELNQSPLAHERWTDHST
jgi:predicted metal-dependent hydrolase